MTSYLIYRHGSNAANQSMTPVMAVAIVGADSAEEAKRKAAAEVNCYNNQFLSVIAEEELTEAQSADWNDVVENDAQMRAVGEKGCIY